MPWNGPSALAGYSTCFDDFITIGAPHSNECAEALQILDVTCAQLGVPIAAHKREGPTTCLTFLGIELDTVSFELRLPPPYSPHRMG